MINKRIYFSLTAKTSITIKIQFPYQLGAIFFTLGNFKNCHIIFWIVI